MKKQKQPKARDYNILKAQMGEINLGTRVINKKYTRKTKHKKMTQE